MNDFFTSKFVQDLKDGKLPPVEVEIKTESLVQIGLVLVIAGAIVLLIGKIVKNV